MARALPLSSLATTDPIDGGGITSFLLDHNSGTSLVKNDANKLSIVESSEFSDVIRATVGCRPHLFLIFTTGYARSFSNQATIVTIY